MSERKATATMSSANAPPAASASAVSDGRPWVLRARGTMASPPTYLPWGQAGEGPVGMASGERTVGVGLMSHADRSRGRSAVDTVHTEDDELQGHHPELSETDEIPDLRRLGAGGGES
jgi:hypothetical protein